MRNEEYIRVQWCHVYYYENVEDMRQGYGKRYRGFAVTDQGVTDIETRDEIDFGRGIRPQSEEKRIKIPEDFGAMIERQYKFLDEHGLLLKNIQPKTLGKIVKYKGYDILDCGYVYNLDTRIMEPDWRYRVTTPCGGEWHVATQKEAKESINEHINKLED